MALPGVFIALGGAAMIAGGAAFALRNQKECEIYGEIGPVEECSLRHPVARPIGLGVMVAGAALATIGLVILPIRLLARNRYALQARSSWIAQLTLTPWVDVHPRGRASGGLVYAWGF